MPGWLTFSRVSNFLGPDVLCSRRFWWLTHFIFKIPINDLTLIYYEDPKRYNFFKK